MPRAGRLDVAQPVPSEAVVLAQLRRSVGALQAKHRLTIRSDHVDVRGPMVVWVNHNP